MTTTDRCDEIVRLIDGALADCDGGASSRRAVTRRRCADSADPTAKDLVAEQRKNMLEAVDFFLAMTLADS